MVPPTRIGRSEWSCIGRGTWRFQPQKTYGCSCRSRVLCGCKGALEAPSLCSLKYREQLYLTFGLWLSFFTYSFLTVFTSYRSAIRCILPRDAPNNRLHYIPLCLSVTALISAPLTELPHKDPGSCGSFLWRYSNSSSIPGTSSIHGWLPTWFSLTDKASWTGPGCNSKLFFSLSRTVSCFRNTPGTLGFGQKWDWINPHKIRPDLHINSLNLVLRIVILWFLPPALSQLHNYVLTLELVGSGCGWKLKSEHNSKKRRLFYFQSTVKPHGSDVVWTFRWIFTLLRTPPNLLGVFCLYWIILVTALQNFLLGILFFHWDTTSLQERTFSQKDIDFLAIYTVYFYLFISCQLAFVFYFSHVGFSWLFAFFFSFPPLPTLPSLCSFDWSTHPSSGIFQKLKMFGLVSVPKFLNVNCQ